MIGVTATKEALEIARDRGFDLVEVSPGACKRLSQGDVAIVNAEGILRTEFALITGKDAHQLDSLDASRILVWNARR